MGGVCVGNTLRGLLVECSHRDGGGGRREGGIEGRTCRDGEEGVEGVEGVGSASEGSGTPWGEQVHYPASLILFLLPHLPG